MKTLHTFLLVSACALSTSVLAADKPNIVFMLVDNLGYGDIGCYGGGELLNNIQPGFDPRVDKIQPLEEGRKGDSSHEVGEYTYAVRPLMDSMITERSVNYIKKQKGAAKPFFLFVSFSLPHAPPLPNPKFKDPDRTDYQNVLREIDHNAGTILDALDETGLRDNTIVVWCSDNGTETHQGNNIMYGAQSDSGPFRGEFPSAWEGALRTPCLIRWPGKVKPDRVSNEIVSILDFYRTFATAAGAADKVPADRPMDGIDLTSFLSGESEKSGREHVLTFYGLGLLAVKWRNFKIHFKIREPMQGAVRMPGLGVVTGEVIEPTIPLIFDIRNDPKELWNIAPANTWIGAAAGKHLGRYMASLKAHPNIKSGDDGPRDENLAQ